jgi:hypothetical protein
VILHPVYQNWPELTTQYGRQPRNLHKSFHQFFFQYRNTESSGRRWKIGIHMTQYSIQSKKAILQVVPRCCRICTDDMQVFCVHELVH